MKDEQLTKRISWAFEVKSRIEVAIELFRAIGWENPRTKEAFEQAWEVAKQMPE